MPPPPKRVRRKRRHKTVRHRQSRARQFLILALLVALGFFIGLFGFSSFHKGWNRWRETRLLKQAADLLQQDKAAGAEEAARKALALDPDSIVASRLLAEATERENRVETVAWRAQVARLAPSFENNLNLASAALRFDQLDIARAALDHVAPDEREKAAYHVVAGWLARAQGNIAEEERHFAAAVTHEPDNDLYQFNLAVLQILAREPEKVTAARSQLERLSKTPQFRTPALRALLEDALRQNQMPAADALAQDLQMSQQVSFSDYLLCLDLYRKLNPKKFGALLGKVKPVAAHNDHDLAQLIDWMNANDLESDALKWTEKLPPGLTSKPPVAIALAESLAETKNFSRLKRWTRNGSWGGDEYLRLAYQSYAAREARHGVADAESDSLWAAAEKEVEDHPERQVILARLASRWKLSQEAEKLWTQVANAPGARREALEALYRIYRQANELPNLRLIAQRLHESSPEEVGLGVDAARLALLLDHNTADGQQLAQEFYEEAPNDTAAAVTYAFALYNTGRTQTGLEVLRKLPPAQLRDPHAAVYAALLLDDDNQTAAADEYVKLAHAGKLYPEEKQLLEEIVTRRQGVTPTPPPTPKSSPPVTPSPAKTG